MDSEVAALKDRIASLEAQLALTNERVGDIGTLRSTVIDHGVKFKVMSGVAAVLGFSAAALIAQAVATWKQLNSAKVELERVAEEARVQIEQELTNRLLDLGLEFYRKDGERWVRVHANLRADSLVSTNEIMVAGVSAQGESADQGFRWTQKVRLEEPVNHPVP